MRRGPPTAWAGWENWRAARCPWPLFAQRAKEALGLGGIRVLDAGVPVRRVAVGGGACGSMLPLVKELGCDTFLTSDLKHDLYLEARELGVNLLDAGHYSTETVVCPVVARWLEEAFPGLWVEIAENQGRFLNICEEKPCQGSFPVIKLSS